MDFERVLDGFWGSKRGENEVRMRGRFEKCFLYCFVFIFEVVLFQHDIGDGTIVL